MSVLTPSCWYIPYRRGLAFSEGEACQNPITYRKSSRKSSTTCNIQFFGVSPWTQDKQAMP